MQYLDQLHTFLLNLDLFAAEQLDSTVDNVIVRPSGRSVRKDQNVIIAELEYTLIIDIERYPHGQRSPHWLFAQVASWMLNHPEIRFDPFEVNFIVDVLDSKTADIEFSLTLNEDIIATPDAQGAIQLAGHSYTLP